jgi:hypothetical protein
MASSPLVRLLDACVAKLQLDDASVHTVRRQAAGIFVSQVVPTQIDPLQLFSVPLRARRLELSGVRRYSLLPA